MIFDAMETQNLLRHLKVTQNWNVI